MAVTIHHLDCGTMTPPLSGRLIGAAAMVDHVLAIVTERDGVILVDTGFGTRDCEDPRRLPAAFRALTRPSLDLAQTARAQLHALGFAPADVRHIVITHLDLDHASGLSDFPDAAVHLHRPEYLAAMAPRGISETARYVPAQLEHGPRWVTYDTGGDTWMDLPAVRQLEGVAAEVALVPLPGHSRGHSGVAVRDGARWLLHAGDAIFHRHELTGGAVPIGLRAIARLDEHDPVARKASVSALRTLAARADVRIVCSHDPAQLPSGSDRSKKI